MSKTVVVLGGAYAGLHVAHALLKKNDKKLKVILVTKVSPSLESPRIVQVAVRLPRTGHLAVSSPVT